MITKTRGLSIYVVRLIGLVVLLSGFPMGETYGQVHNTENMDNIRIIGAGVPASSLARSVGMSYFQTDATPGYNVWYATAIGVWTNGRTSDQDYVHATFRSPTGATGIFHAFGYYTAPAASTARNQGAPSQTSGTANNAYGAKAFSVASGAGTASGGTKGVPVLTVHGTSFNPATGVRSAADSEVLVADATAEGLNSYHETTKFWIGQVTYTLTQNGDRVNFAFTFNYGFGVPAYFNSTNVTLERLTCTGRAGANDAGFNIQVLKHTTNGVGWTYSAAAFVPGGTVLWALATDYVNERNLVNTVRWRWSLSALSTVINGASGEGIVFRITTTQNSAIESSDFRIYYSIN